MTTELKFEKMSPEELRDELRMLEETLADLEMERSLLLRQTGVHISAKAFQRQQELMDKEIAEVQKRLDIIRGYLKGGLDEG